jgi:hypothetical protein
MDEIEFKPERVALHRCRCLVLPIDRCPALVPMDQPVCDDCEVAHFGEHRERDAVMVPLGQP